MVDHFRLRWVQACGEGESGAYNETFSKEKRLTPPPRLERGKTRKYNRHNTLSPFQDDPLCSAIDQIKRESNVCPFQRQKCNGHVMAMRLACICICTRLLLCLTHSPSTMHWIGCYARSDPIGIEEKIPAGVGLWYLFAWERCSHPSAGGQPAPFPTLIYIIPFFLSETATRSRVATPDSAIAVSLVSTLGGGADSVRRILMIYQSQ